MQLPKLRGRRARRHEGNKAGGPEWLDGSSENRRRIDHSEVSGRNDGRMEDQKPQEFIAILAINFQACQTESSPVLK